MSVVAYTHFFNFAFSRIRRLRIYGYHTPQSGQRPRRQAYENSYESGA